MASPLHLLPGANVIEQPIGNFRPQIRRGDRGGIQATLTATALPPQHLTERQRASGIPTTVDMSTSADDLLDLARSILQQATIAGIKLPPGVSIQS